MGDQAIRKASAYTQTQTQNSIVHISVPQTESKPTITKFQRKKISRNFVHVTSRIGYNPYLVGNTASPLQLTLKIEILIGP
jgi:hypothetical protein